MTAGGGKASLSQAKATVDQLYEELASSTGGNGIFKVETVLLPYLNDFTPTKNFSEFSKAAFQLAFCGVNQKEQQSSSPAPRAKLHRAEGTETLEAASQQDEARDTVDVPLVVAAGLDAVAGETTTTADVNKIESVADLLPPLLTYGPDGSPTTATYFPLAQFLEGASGPPLDGQAAVAAGEALGREAGPLGQGPTAQAWLQATALTRLAGLWREHSHAMDHVAVAFAERAFAVHTRLLARLADQRDSAVAEVLEGVQRYAEEVTGAVKVALADSRKLEDTYAQELYNTCRAEFIKGIDAAIAGREAWYREKLGVAAAKHREQLQLQRMSAQKEVQEALARLTQHYDSRLDEEVKSVRDRVTRERDVAVAEATELRGRVVGLGGEVEVLNEQLAMFRQEVKANAHWRVKFEKERLRSQALKREADETASKQEVGLARLRDTHKAELMQKDAQFSKAKDTILKLELTVAEQRHQLKAANAKLHAVQQQLQDAEPTLQAQQPVSQAPSPAGGHHSSPTQRPRRDSTMPDRSRRDSSVQERPRRESHARGARFSLAPVNSAGVPPSTEGRPLQPLPEGTSGATGKHVDGPSEGTGGGHPREEESAVTPTVAFSGAVEGAASVTVDSLLHGYMARDVNPQEVRSGTVMAGESGGVVNGGSGPAQGAGPPQRPVGDGQGEKAFEITETAKRDLVATASRKQDALETATAEATDLLFRGDEMKMRRRRNRR